MARDTSQTLVVKGWQPLQASLKKAAGDTDKRLRVELRTLAKGVLVDARTHAPTGPRPKTADTPPLAGSLKVSVTNAGVSVYSNAKHAYVQDRGGKVGHGAIVPRASASGYMTKAVSENRAKIAREIDRLVGKIADDIHT